MVKYFSILVFLVMVSNTFAFEIVRNSQAKAAIVVPKYEDKPTEKKWSDKATA